MYVRYDTSLRAESTYSPAKVYISTRLAPNLLPYGQGWMAAIRMGLIDAEDLGSATTHGTEVRQRGR